MKILLSINIDGASRGNPGPSGIGISIIKRDKLILRYGEFIGIQTNIQSEYFALKRALEIAIGIDLDIMIFSDCFSVVRQRKIKNRVRKKGLRTLTRQISNLEKNFNRISYMFIPRRKNINVDRVANQAIDDYFNTNNTSLYSRQQ